jgi:hypothetical protein
MHFNQMLVKRRSQVRLENKNLTFRKKTKFSGGD